MKPSRKMIIQCFIALVIGMLMASAAVARPFESPVSPLAMPRVIEVERQIGQMLTIERLTADEVELMLR